MKVLKFVLKLMKVYEFDIHIKCCKCFGSKTILLIIHYCLTYVFI